MKKAMNIIMGLAIFLSLAGAAWAANCGGGVACECGDTVNANTVLDAVFDPVVSTDINDFCPDDGLIVNGGVTLDLAGKIIRGNHTSIGVKINGDNAVVTNGTVRGFATGVSTGKDGGTISKIKALRNKTEGIKVTGDLNTLLSNQANENGIDGNGKGINVSGDDNTLQSNKANRNAGIGIDVAGKRNVLEKNAAEENAKDGIQVSGGIVGNGNTLTSNKATSNREKGINVAGNGNTLDKNTAKDNFDHGIYIGGDSNTLTKNAAHENFASGVFVASGGEGNTLEGNKADKNSDDGVSVNGKANTLEKNTAKKNEGEGIFAKFQTLAANKNIDDGGNKGTDNGGVADDGLVGEVNCEIDEAPCL